MHNFYFIWVIKFYLKIYSVHLVYFFLNFVLNLLKLHFVEPLSISTVKYFIYTDILLHFFT